MSKPGDLPVWATDANYPVSADPWSGQPTKVEPTSGDQALGFTPFQEPAPEIFNWWMNLVYLWILWLNGLWGTDGSLTMDVDASIELKGEGELYHEGIRTITLAPLMGSPGTDSAVWGTVAGDGVPNPETWWWTIPIEEGRILKQVRVSLKDAAAFSVGITFYQNTYYGVRGNWSHEGGGLCTGNASTNELTFSFPETHMELGAGPFRFASTTGTLPAPLALATDYYLIPLTSTTVKLATTYKNALDGTFIDLTASGSGTHDLAFSPGNGFAITTSNGTGNIQTVTINGNIRAFKRHAYAVKLSGPASPNLMNLHLLEADYVYPRPV